VNIEGGTIDIVLLYGAMLTINGGTINSFDNYCNYGGETVITGGTFDLGNGPFFYCWFKNGSHMVI